MASEVVWLFMGHGRLVAFLLPHAVCRTRAALWWLFRDPVNAPVHAGFHTQSSGLPRVTGARLTAAVQDPVWVLLHIQVGQKKKDFLEITWCWKAHVGTRLQVLLLGADSEATRNFCRAS